MISASASSRKPPLPQVGGACLKKRELSCLLARSELLLVAYFSHT